MMKRLQIIIVDGIEGRVESISASGNTALVTTVDVQPGVPSWNQLIAVLCEVIVLETRTLLPCEWRTLTTNRHSDFDEMLGTHGLK